MQIIYSHFLSEICDFCLNFTNFTFLLLFLWLCIDWNGEVITIVRRNAKQSQFWICTTAWKYMGKFKYSYIHSNTRYMGMTGVLGVIYKMKATFKKGRTPPCFLLHVFPHILLFSWIIIIIIIVVGTTAHFESRPSSEASASCPYSLQHSSNFSPPTSWRLPSHHLPIFVSVCPFCLLPSTTATTLLVRLCSSIPITCPAHFNRLILMYVTI